MWRKLVFVVLLACMLVAGWGSPVTAQEPTTESDIPEEAKIVQDGGYEVVVLTSEMNEIAGDQLHAALNNEFGEEVLVWSVEEKTGKNYVYAYPTNSFGILASQTSLENFRTQIRSIISGAIEGDATLSNDTIFIAFRENNDWTGAGLTFSELAGSPSQQMERLDWYGFDNRISSYWEVYSNTGSHTTPAWARLYDGWYFGSHLSYLWSSTAFTGSYAWLDNRASSLIVYFQ